jgi:hypothetical protein
MKFYDRRARRARDRHALTNPSTKQDILVYIWQGNIAENVNVYVSVCVRACVYARARP